MAEQWTITYRPPPSGSIAPKPFSALNHFTAPSVIDRTLRPMSQHDGVAAPVVLGKRRHQRMRPPQLRAEGRTVSQPTALSGVPGLSS